MAPCWLSFGPTGASGAPGHASGGSMCPKGGLDLFWEHFGVKWLPRDWILMVLGSIWAPFWMPFEGPHAPGRASGGSLCPGMAWIHFGTDSGSQLDPKSIQNAFNYSLRGIPTIEVDLMAVGPSRGQSWGGGRGDISIGCHGSRGPQGAVMGRRP